VGIPSIWHYRGREIKVKRPERGLTFWTSEWTEKHPLGDPDEEELLAFGVDEQSALANARYRIDVSEKQKKFPGYILAETMVSHTIDAMSDYETGKINRSTVARRIEEFRRMIMMGKRPGYLVAGVWKSVPIREWQMNSFYGMPLRERTKLIDEAIIYQTRGRLIDPKRLSNPTRRRKKPGKKRADGKKLLRQLMRNG
jgi:hypothetical protein